MNIFDKISLIVSPILMITSLISFIVLKEIDYFILLFVLLIYFENKINKLNK